jgi:hypothetical protein
LIAIKATARKIAVLYYNVMTKGIDYVEKGILDYQKKVKKQKMKYLKTCEPRRKQAKQLGYSLLPMIT